MGNVKEESAGREIMEGEWEVGVRLQSGTIAAASRGIVVSVLGYHSDGRSSNPVRECTVCEVDCENLPYKSS